MRILLAFLILFLSYPSAFSAMTPPKPIRILVITGGHDYNIESFNEMLASMGPEIPYQVIEFPAAYNMFLPVNRS